MQHEVEFFCNDIGKFYQEETQIKKAGGNLMIIQTELEMIFCVSSTMLRSALEQFRNQLGKRKPTKEEFLLICFSETMEEEIVRFTSKQIDMLRRNLKCAVEQ